MCRDPGSNREPSDLQSDALPTELSRPVCRSFVKNCPSTCWFPKQRKATKNVKTSCHQNFCAHPHKDPFESLGAAFGQTFRKKGREGNRPRARGLRSTSATAKFMSWVATLSFFQFAKHFAIFISSLDGASRSERPEAKAILSEKESRVVNHTEFTHKSAA